ncbi:MAG: photosystem I reaction center subunit IV [Gammaproteobacteria bacterium]|nr:photosystem I reaction center subunit IV [Gammaproteobacteria bacterium]
MASAAVAQDLTDSEKGGQESSGAEATHSQSLAFAPALPSPRAPRSIINDVARAGDRLVAIGEQGHIIYSDDDGSTWVHAQVPVSVMLTSVAFASASAGWAVGHEGIVLHSEDRGASWNIQLDGKAIADMQKQAAAAKIERLQQQLDALDDADAQEEMQYALEDAEFALEDLETLGDEGINTPLLSVIFFSPSEGFATGAYGVVLHTRDAGKNWSLLSGRLKNPDGFHIYGIGKSVSGALFAVGEAGKLFRSVDGGEQWQALDSPYQGSFFGVLTPPDGSVVIFGLRGRIYRSSDEGETWQAADSPAQATLMGGTVLEDGQLLLGGASGTILVSSDFGQSFSELATDYLDTVSSISARRNGDLIITGLGGIEAVDRDTGGD